MKVSVYMRSYAFYTASVELTDAELKSLADEYEITVNELTAEHIREMAESKAFAEPRPWLCHMETVVLGDEWDTDDKTEHAINITER